ncbi:MAG: presenilin family intramembrane aspartyl protease [Candidatus Methanofastidiosia archaeon]
MKFKITSNVLVVLSLLVVQVLSLCFALMLASNEVEIVEGGASVETSMLFFLLILFTTVVMLVLIKFGFSKYVYKFTEYFGLAFLTFFLFAFSTESVLIGFGTALLFLLLKVFIKKRSVDVLSAIMVAVGISTLVGITFGPIPIIVLLVLLSIYDFIAVKKTKHMLVLAEDVIKRGGPQIISFAGEDEKIVIGLGDIIFPSALFVSAFVSNGIMTAVLTSITSIAGLMLLFRASMGEGMPAIPFVSLGIAGYIAGIILF